MSWPSRGVVPHKGGLLEGLLVCQEDSRWSAAKVLGWTPKGNTVPISGKRQGWDRKPHGVGLSLGVCHWCSDRHQLSRPRS